LKYFCISTLENDNKVFSITITRLDYQPNVGQAGAVFLSLLRVDRLFITKAWVALSILRRDDNNIDGRGPELADVLKNDAHNSRELSKR